MTISDSELGLELLLVDDDPLSTRHAQIMRSRSYSDQLLKEAKRIAEKQRKERAVLLRNASKTKKVQCCKKIQER